MKDLTISRFRTARGRILRRQIEKLADHLGRPVSILDVGGRPDYWENVGHERISEIRLLNIDENEIDRHGLSNLFTSEIGDARDLKGYADKSVDLVHSNSVIEHVGAWPDMSAMASEMQRVGLSGWIQTPAWEFPIEPHFRLPFLHWLAPPMRRVALKLSKDYGALDVATRRYHIDRINLLSYSEVRALFPIGNIYVEKFVFSKSYSARWGPGAA
ncbi:MULTISPECIES: class I SAM-dependent methyltransferase [Rhizobium/Agrobacterium group]|jgi:hypothetical protein|uniref:class I SAM-dependent methyltransferase n=1 Tax=Rhizobium/Agrobacterium group TaxID=227290 RepID=UPI000712C145|nr:class I SAM-dependent methyltransferase [Rhizobium sp. Root483D2]KQY45872.1 hypothetical protein ASD32_11795 [Rhizobium sp. Root483D2]